MDWKVNDWCFCEFKLQMIKEIKEGRITEVSDGYFCMGGHDLSDRCYPLSLQSKINSENVRRWSNDFHKIKNNTINYPEIHRTLVEKWQEICNAGNDNKILNILFEQLNKWGNKSLDRLKNLEQEKQEGVKYE